MNTWNMMMLGETTGNKRSKEDFDFLGTNAERYLWQELERWSLYREDFYTYSIFGDLGHNHTKLSQEELEDKRLEFRRELVMVEPDLTLAVGRHPTEELLECKLAGEFYDATGKILYSTKYDIWFVSCIHPTTVARDKDKLSILQSNIENFYLCYQGLKDENNRLVQSNDEHI